MSGLERQEADPAYGWQARANCATADPELMFPEKGDHSAARAAKVICGRCVVREECLADAIKHPELHGIRGGHTPSEIQALRRDYYAQQRAEAQIAHRAKYERAAAMRAE